MAFGLKYVLSDFEFPSSARLPIIKSHPLLTNGSLALFAPYHSDGSFSGIPANGSPVPNVAWREAAQVLGSGDKESLKFVASSILPAGIAVAERSGKGGVHVISTQSGAQNSNAYWFISSASQIRNYIISNQSSHEFYVSMWRQITRPALPANPGQSPFHFALNTSNYLFLSNNGRFTGENSFNSNDSTDSSAEAGSVRLSAKKPVVSGTGVTTSTNIQYGAGAFSSWGSTNYNKAASVILEQCYIEDLTVSGRSYEEALEIDHSLFMAAHSPGGVYYNDTYSPPSTVLP